MAQRYHVCIKEIKLIKLIKRASFTSRQIGYDFALKNMEL